MQIIYKMTRINCGIPPADLTDKHLLAEHREIKRIPNTIKSGKANLTDIPTTFCLGPGHVKFFYNKLFYLRKRYIEIYTECIKRGFNVTNFIEAFDKLPTNLCFDYQPTKADKQLIKNRIAEKLFKN
jgi:hypothetical protein